MKYEAIVLLLVGLSLGISSTILVYANHEGYEPEQTKECQFTAYLEKSWVLFTERPWVSGIVIGCDSQIWEYTDNELLYAMKDTIQVKIFDIDGNLVDDHKAKKKKVPISDEIVYSKYSFRDYVYRGGSITAHLDAALKGSQYLEENRYYFEMPQINSRDFEHRGVYQIELIYGDHVRTLWFASFNPDIPWQLEQVEDSDPCIDFKEKSKRLQNTIVSLEKSIERYTSLGQYEKVSAGKTSLDNVVKQIESLKECQG